MLLDFVIDPLKPASYASHQFGQSSYLHLLYSVEAVYTKITPPPLFAGSETDILNKTQEYYSKISRIYDSRNLHSLFTWRLHRDYTETKTWRLKNRPSTSLDPIGLTLRSLPYLSLFVPYRYYFLFKSAVCAFVTIHTEKPSWCSPSWC